MGWEYEHMIALRNECLKILDFLEIKCTGDNDLVAAPKHAITELTRLRADNETLQAAAKQFAHTIGELRSELLVNAKLLADQSDLARVAETDAMKLREENERLKASLKPIEELWERWAEVSDEDIDDAIQKCMEGE